MRVWRRAPSATAVLLLHLHRRESKPSVAHPPRYRDLYTSTTADVFVTPGLGVFVLALLLSLVGAAFGIALRIRAKPLPWYDATPWSRSVAMARMLPDGPLSSPIGGLNFEMPCRSSMHFRSHMLLTLESFGRCAGPCCNDL